MIASKKVKKTMDLYIKSIDSVITIEEPDRALCRDANDIWRQAEGDKYMCYECIKEPDIKSKEVQDAFGCAVPMDVLLKLYLHRAKYRRLRLVYETCRIYGRCGSRKKLIQTDGDLEAYSFLSSKGFDWDRLSGYHCLKKYFKGEYGALLWKRRRRV